MTYRIASFAMTLSYVQNHPSSTAAGPSFQIRISMLYCYLPITFTPVPYVIFTLMWDCWFLRLGLWVY